MGICACSSGSSSATPAASGPGFDCQALSNKQAAASCPKFDATQYLADCNAELMALSASCKPQLDAFASCILGQPVGCTDAGTIDDDTPVACAAQDDALQACGSGDGGK